MKIAWIDKFSEADATEVIKELEILGVEVVDNPDSSTRFVICGSIMKQDRAAELIREYDIIAYCWDFYKWAKEGKHAYLNWGKYEALLRKCTDVWVPSSSQQLRLSEWDIPSHIIHTAIKVYDHEVNDKGVIIDPVRWYEHDPNCYWVKDACEELGLPFFHTEHQLSYEDFKVAVHNSRFMTCGYIEASTGGLTLIEGLWNGKPSLVSDSPYMGAKDYLGKFGTYFKHSDFNDLKEKLSMMYHDPPQINVEEAREYIRENFSAKTMARKIKERLCELSDN